MLHLYNTLTRKKEPFKPGDEKTAKLYHCGPTVYHYVHLGNLRAFLFADILRRAIENEGYEVKQVMNITDVGHLVSDDDQGEDKMEKGAKREGKKIREIADFYTKSFFADIDQLNIKNAHLYPRATNHIREQIALIERLEDGEYTYTTSDGVYFDTSKYQDYTKLAKLDLKGQKEGTRDVKKTEKRNPADFALWKFSQEDEKREQEWWAPWKNPQSKNNEKHTNGTPRAEQSNRMQGSGEGRSEVYNQYDERALEPLTQQTARQVYGSWGYPGWHVECSAMAMKYLGETLDIHTGGIDLVPTHHTNERAQSVCATGVEFSRFWMHSEFVNVTEGKMAKSEGNFLTLENLIEDGFYPLAYRYWLLTAHYRTTVEFRKEALEASQKALDHLYALFRDYAEDSTGKANESYLGEFNALISDDLHTPKALALLWKLVDDPSVEEHEKKATLLQFDEVLGLDLQNAKNHQLAFLTREEIPEADVQKMIEEREEARANKDWEKADQIRDKIFAFGYEIKDQESGPQVRKTS